MNDNIDPIADDKNHWRMKAMILKTAICRLLNCLIYGAVFNVFASRKDVMAIKLYPHKRACK